MMGGQRAPAMMAPASGPLLASARPLPGAELRRRLAAFAAAWRPAATLQGVMPFAVHTSAVLVDPASGQGLAEVLVNRYSGAVGLEPGPSPLWTTRTASSGGWRGALPGSRLSEAAVREVAHTFLAFFLPGAAETGGHLLSGYSTFDHRLRGGEGLLSVNAQTGQIWPHTWPGPAGHSGRARLPGRWRPPYGRAGQGSGVD